MSLLHTFSMGVKTDARLPRSERFASIMRSCVLSPPAARAGVLEPLQKESKWEWSRFEHTSSLTFFIPGAPPIFFNGSNTPALRAKKNATTHNGGEPFAPGKSRIDFHSHRECMEETYEYANELENKVGKI